MADDGMTLIDDGIRVAALRPGPAGPSGPEAGRRAAEHVLLLQRLLQIVLQEAPLEELLGQSLDALLGLSWMGLQPRGGIFLADGAGATLRLVVQRNLDAQIVSLCARVPFGRCLCGRAAASRRIQHAGCIDARHETRHASMAPHGHYNVPILDGDRVLGVIVLYLPHGHARDPEEETFLESFAAVLAMLILACRREADLAETRDRLAETLARASDLLGALREHTLFSHMDRSGLIIDAGEALLAASGFARDELAGRPHSALSEGCHPQAFFETMQGQLAAGRIWHGEICCRRKDGTLFWLDSLAVPLRANDGSFGGFLRLDFDITQRRRAEDKLATMGRILDESANEIYVFDAETWRFRMVNHGACRNLGYSEAELLGMTPLDIKPLMTRAAFAGLVATLRDGRSERLVFETMHRRRDGSLYPAEIALHLAAREDPPSVVAIVQDITERKAKDQRIEQLAFHDPLTGLANRSLMNDRLRGAVSAAVRRGGAVDLFFIDLDRFKEINDTLGHAAGDAVLVETARRLTGTIRASDTAARIGGDEFVVIASNMRPGGSRRLAERLLGRLRQPVLADGRQLHVGASIGVANFPGDAATAEALLQKADIAMYAAKAGGGGVAFYGPELDAGAGRRLTIAERLGAALAGGGLGFSLVFQPLIDLGSGAPAGAEALLRWQDAALGAVSPAELFAVAHDRHFTGAIDEWVVDNVCRQIALWRRQGLALPGPVAINLGAAQLQDPAFADRIAAAVARHAIPRDLIAIEITEQGLIGDIAQAARMLRKLKQMDMSVAIDDFGTGYSSLAYLRRLAVDRLKIDRSFITDLPGDTSALAIVEATLAMARSLGLHVVAEGVEMAEQAETLRRLGCRFAQGYLWDAPLPASAFAARWLATAGGRVRRSRAAAAPARQEAAAE